MRIVVGAVFLVALSFGDEVLAATTTEEDAEIAANSVKTRFYMMSQNDWDNKQGTFKTSMAAAASQHCKSNMAACGLSYWETSYEFTDTDVISTSQTLEENDVYLDVVFYVKFNSNVPLSYKNDTLYILNKKATEDALVSILGELNDELGHAVVGVGSEEYSPPPNKRMNTIMIPVAVVVLLVIPIVALISCLCYKRQQDKKVAREERHMQLKGKLRESKAKRSANEEANRHQGGGSPGNSAKVAPAPGKKASKKDSSNGTGQTQSKENLQTGKEYHANADDPFDEKTVPGPATYNPKYGSSNNLNDEREHESEIEGKCGSLDTDTSASTRWSAGDGHREDLPPLDPSLSEKAEKRRKKKEKKRNREKKRGSDADSERDNDRYHVINEHAHTTADDSRKQPANLSVYENEAMDTLGTGEQELSNTQTTEFTDSNDRLGMRLC